MKEAWGDAGRERLRSDGARCYRSFLPMKDSSFSAGTMPVGRAMHKLAP